MNTRSKRISSIGLCFHWLYMERSLCYGLSGYVFSPKLPPMQIRYRIAIASVLVAFLVLIRFYEQSLFYDPLMEFYQSDYLHDTIPHFITWKLLANVFLRFVLNSGISLAILYVAFLDKNILKFSFLLYLLLFISCFSAFTFLILTVENENFMALFYMRRFLIQPLFLILLLPAFYYYRLKNSVKIYGNKWRCWMCAFVSNWYKETYLIDSEPD